ncbi:hypothetical protein ACFQU7_38715 [Pseudoroseomonas wenyumeiae]
MPTPLIGNGTEIPPATVEKAPGIEQDTSHVCTVDRWGNAFCATPSPQLHRALHQPLKELPPRRHPVRPHRQ